MVQLGQGVVGGQVILHRHHTDMVVAQCPFVRVLSGVNVGEVPGHPVIGPAAGGFSFFESIGPMPCSLSTDANALELVGRNFGDVDIEAGAFGRAMLKDLLGQGPDDPA